MMDITSLLFSKMTWCDELTDKQSRPTITIDVMMWPSHFGLKKIRALTWLALKPRIDWLGLQYFDSNIFLKLTHSHGLWLAHTRCGASCARTQSIMGHFLFLNNHSGYVWSLLCQERVTEYSICKGDMIERNDIRGILFSLTIAQVSCKIPRRWWLSIRAGINYDVQHCPVGDHSNESEPDLMSQ